LGAYESEEEGAVGLETPKEKVAKKVKEPQVINLADDDDDKPEPRIIPRKDRDARMANDRPR
jgi:hypothetical protein